MFVPSPQEWQFFTSVASLLGASVAGVKGYRKFDKRTSRLEETTSTLRPNGGSSIADAVRRIEVKQDSSNELLANLTGRFEQHLSDSESAKQEWNQWRLSQETSRSRPRRSSERTAPRSSAD